MHERNLFSITVASAYLGLMDIYYFLKYENQSKSAYYMFIIFVVFVNRNDEEQAHTYAGDGKDITAC